MNYIEERAKVTQKVKEKLHTRSIGEKSGGGGVCSAEGDPNHISLLFTFSCSHPRKIHLLKLKSIHSHNCDSGENFGLPATTVNDMRAQKGRGHSHPTINKIKYCIQVYDTWHLQYHQKMCGR